MIIMIIQCKPQTQENIHSILYWFIMSICFDIDHIHGYFRRNVIYDEEMCDYDEIFKEIKLINEKIIQSHIWQLLDLNHRCLWLFQLLGHESRGLDVQGLSFIRDLTNSDPTCLWLFGLFLTSLICLIWLIDSRFQNCDGRRFWCPFSDGSDRGVLLLDDLL